MTRPEWDGMERRTSSEELGYIKAKLEEYSEDIKDIKANIKEHTEQEMLHTQDISSTLKELQKELDMYKTVVWTVKAIGASIILVLAFKFGDIGALWRGE